MGMGRRRERRGVRKRLEGQGWRVDGLWDGSSIEVRGDVREHRIVLGQRRERGHGGGRDGESGSMTSRESRVGEEGKRRKGEEWGRRFGRDVWERGGTMVKV